MLVMHYPHLQHHYNRAAGPRLAGKHNVKQNKQKDLHTALKTWKVGHETPLMVALQWWTGNNLSDALSPDQANQSRDIITTQFQPGLFGEAYETAQKTLNNPDYAALQQSCQYTWVTDVTLMRHIHAISSGLTTDTHRSITSIKNKRTDAISSRADMTWHIDQKHLVQSWSVCLEKASAAVYWLSQEWYTTEIVYGMMEDEAHAALMIRGEHGQMYYVDITNPFALWKTHIPRICPLSHQEAQSLRTAREKNDISIALPDIGRQRHTSYHMAA